VKLFQIKEDDLETLEQVLPALLGDPRIMPLMNDAAMRAKFRRLQQVIVNVRWNYGPPSEVEATEGDHG
jgi:hypothetical protein